MSTWHRDRMTRRLLEASHTSTMDELPAVVAACAADAGLHNTLIYAVDLQEEVLRPLTGEVPEVGGPSGGGPPELSIESTTAGRAFQYVEVFHEPVIEGDRSESEVRRYWVPLLNGTQRLGVLGVVAPNSPDRESEEAMRQLAAIVALMLVSRHTYSDSYARLVRTRPMSVAAELQWALMPSPTFANQGVTISAALEPAYEIAGDAFDYAVAGDTVHLAMFDSMGHDVLAGLTANLAVAACRNQRRQGAGLADLGKAIEDIVIQQVDGERYLTALLADLDTRTGELRWVNHGHHPPVLIRDNQWHATLVCPPSHPLGTCLELPAKVCTLQLEPGDRILMYTDGITEARRPEDENGMEFGLQQLVDFLIRHNDAGVPVPEVLRRLVHSVMEHHHGRLQDDATVLFLEWRGDTYRELKL